MKLVVSSNLHLGFTNTTMTSPLKMALRPFSKLLDWVHLIC